VVAIADGHVDFAGWKGGYGRFSSCATPERLETVYGHFEPLCPRGLAGAKGVQGEVIGYVGKTGLAHRAALHMKFWKGLINPLG